MKAKTISELVQPATSVLRECLFSVRIALPTTHSLLARLRRHAHGAPGPYRSKLRAGLSASRVARAADEAGLPYMVRCSCSLRMLYPIGWSDLIGPTRFEPLN